MSDEPTSGSDDREPESGAPAEDGTGGSEPRPGGRAEEGKDNAPSKGGPPADDSRDDSEADSGEEGKGDQNDASGDGSDSGRPVAAGDGGKPAAADDGGKPAPTAGAGGKPAAADDGGKPAPTDAAGPAADSPDDGAKPAADAPAGAAKPASAEDAKPAPSDDGAKPAPGAPADRPGDGPTPPAGTPAYAAADSGDPHPGAPGNPGNPSAPGSPEGPGRPEDGPGAEADPGPEGHPAAAAASTTAADGGKGRKGRKVKRRRTGWRRLLPTWRMVLGGVLLVVLLVSGALVAGYLLVSIPPPNKAAAAQTNVFLYADGTQIARDGEVNRENITLGQVPKKTQHAVLAAEDRDFYNESAVDPKAMIRAGWNMATGQGRQSGSTITQQYVKNYYLDQDQTVTRKAKEFFIALKLDREVSKNEILQGYLNTSYFGRNAYGIQSAAHAYYGKDVNKLSVGESAYLAALVNSPNAYDTRAHPENKRRAMARWNYVLDGMVKEGWLKKSDRAGLKFPEPEEATPPGNLAGERGYLIEAVKNYLISNKIIDERRLAAGGFRITTTLQPKKQKAMRDAVNDELMSRLDKKNRKVDGYVRAGGASVDPKSGKVVAMYGGIGYTKQFMNNATRRDYQVGSTFKPFLFTSAVQNRSKTQDGTPINAGTMYDGTNKREVMSDGRPTDYAPANEDDRSYGQIPVSTAMDKSVNSVFAQMGVDVGPRKVKNTAIDLGIPKNVPNMPEDGSIALGVTTASTLDMAEAYATLANHGKRGHFSMVSKATRGGEVIDLPGHDPKQEVPRVAADSTTAVLRSVVKSGTGTAAQSAGRPAAGKTGTAEEDKAAWFAGFTPELSTVISVMGQNSDTGAQQPLYGAAGEARINGGGYPAKIWGSYTKEALKGRPVQDFKLKTNGNADLPSSPPPSTGAPSSEAPPATGSPSSEPPPSSQPPPSSPEEPEPPTSDPPESPAPPSIPEIGGVDGGDPGGEDPGGAANGDPGGGPGGPGDQGNGWDGGAQSPRTGRNW